MIEVVDVSRDKRVADGRRALKAIDKAGGVPKEWKGNKFKYFGYVKGRPVFAVSNTVVYIDGDELKEAKSTSEL